MSAEDIRLMREALARCEKRLTDCANAFYVKGKASAMREAFDGWRDDALAARAELAKHPLTARASEVQL